MKNTFIALLFIISINSCSLLKENDMTINARIVNAIINNPDTLRFFAKDTNYIVKSKFHLYSDDGRIEVFIKLINEYFPNRKAITIESQTETVVAKEKEWEIVYFYIKDKENHIQLVIEFSKEDGNWKIDSYGDYYNCSQRPAREKK
ncbi:MAG: hypothetical protein NT007_13510 [Candidatus Kapabacteria bacterium]|nr:hypothetical protein [Candidatus Kapabacteria bacterium]